jgi:predicted transcriptional regulator
VLSKIQAGEMRLHITELDICELTRGIAASFESLAKILSERNMLLLETIRRGQPQSLKDLSRLSGRAVSNLSRTLHNMERFGLVELRDEEHRKVPVVRYERVKFEVALDSDENPPQAA